MMQLAFTGSFGYLQEDTDLMMPEPFQVVQDQYFPVTGRHSCQCIVDIDFHVLSFRAVRNFVRRRAAGFIFSVVFPRAIEGNAP